MNLLDDIPENTLVGIDAVIWIYEFENNPVFAPLTGPFFRDRLNTGKNRAGASVLTLGELLVKPLMLGRTDLVAAYRTTFSSRPGFDVWEATRDVVEKAAELRAKYKLKMLDALAHGVRRPEPGRPVSYQRRRAATRDGNKGADPEGLLARDDPMTGPPLGGPAGGVGGFPLGAVHGAGDAVHSMRPENE